jgi:hypothetical protein
MPILRKKRHPERAKKDTAFDIGVCQSHKFALINFDDLSEKITKLSSVESNAVYFITPPK